MNIQKQKMTILLTVLIDVVGLGIIIPTLPFYVERFGASPFTITLLFSVFALCSFFSGPLLGTLSDRIGRRPVLIISIASSAIGWLVFAAANAVWVLFLGRIIDGLAAGNFPIAQSYLVDLSRDDKERTTNLGLIGAIFGVGFIVGPAIGAALGAIDPALPFWFVGALAFVNMIGAYFFLPETNKSLDVEKKISLNPFTPIKRAVKDRDLRSHYGAWFLFGLAMSMQQAIFALYLNAIFGLTAAVVGTIFTITGVLMVINQAYALRQIWLKYFKESFLEVWPFLGFAIGFFAMAIHNLIIFFAGMFLVFLSQSILRVVMSSGAAGIAGHQRRGEVLGIMSSILSLAMVIGPIVAGAVFTAHKSLPYILGGIAVFAAFLIMYRRCKAMELEGTVGEIEVGPIM